MDGFIERFNSALGAINSVIWHNYVLYLVLGVGILFTIWSVFCQYRALTHGVAVTRGKYDNKDDPGAINHFQALSAALSATVGLGNIGGVALAIALGGPGAVFWMWMIGLAGMALKTTEVTLSMLYRNTDDPDNPHGGPMYVASKGFEKMGFPRIGKVVGAIFVVTLLISAITGGNMFQAWNVGVVTEKNFHVPQQVVGAFLAILVGLVILGGIKRIGAVAGRLVPFMCLLYFVSALYVITIEFDRIPEMLILIVRSAFNPLESHGAFLGGTAGYAFLWGMKRALFSSEAGQGSSPIAHSAAKTSEPVREAVVAGLEPFIDTIVVCTLTTLVVLLSGAWDRGPEAYFQTSPQVISTTEGRWTVQPVEPPTKTDDAKKITGQWKSGDTVFLIADGDLDKNTGRNLHRFSGTIKEKDGALAVEWNSYKFESQPTLQAEEDGRYGLYNDFVGAALTSHAFDRISPGLGKWLVTIASWLFAVSTMISWSYYGEQGIVYLLGEKMVLGYKLMYCALILVACGGFIRSDEQLDNLTALGTGVMLWANIPIMLIFGAQAMRAYHSYFKRLKAGDFHPHAAPSIIEVAEGKDVE